MNVGAILHHMTTPRKPREVNPEQEQFPAMVLFDAHLALVAEVPTDKGSVSRHGKSMNVIGEKFQRRHPLAMLLQVADLPVTIHAG